MINQIENPIDYTTEDLVPPDFRIEITQSAIGNVLRNGYPNYPNQDARLQMTEEQYTLWIATGKPLTQSREDQNLPHACFNHPNYLNGLKRGLAVEDEGSHFTQKNEIKPSYCDRPIEYDSIGRPMNPYAREMLLEGVAVSGPGFYWEYGPNYAADTIVFRISTDENRRETLQVLLIRRKDNNNWALPGGMLDKNEPWTNAAARELFEEAGIDTSKLDHQTVYRGLVIDPRMTLNSWVESQAELVVVDSDSSSNMNPKAGEDAIEVGWFDINEELLANLFASHADFVRKAVLIYLSRDENKDSRVLKNGRLGDKAN